MKVETWREADTDLVNLHKSVQKHMDACVGEYTYVDVKDIKNAFDYLQQMINKPKFAVRLIKGDAADIHETSFDPSCPSKAVIDGIPPKKRGRPSKNK